MSLSLRVSKATFSSVIFLSLLSFLSACHHEGLPPHASYVPKLKRDISHCEWLARSVASQYQSDKGSLWFYEFGKENSKQDYQDISDYVNHHSSSDTAFVNFTALSIYDLIYQHMGIDAVISLCLERKGYHHKTTKMALATLSR